MNSDNISWYKNRIYTITIQNESSINKIEVKNLYTNYASSACFKIDFLSNSFIPENYNYLSYNTAQTKMALRDSKPDYDTYFSDPALVKAFYIPTDPIKLTEKQRMVGTLESFLSSSYHS